MARVAEYAHMQGELILPGVPTGITGNPERAYVAYVAFAPRLLP
jgi:hypothetical protein